MPPDAEWSRALGVALALLGALAALQALASALGILELWPARNYGGDAPPAFIHALEADRAIEGFDELRKRLDAQTARDAAQRSRRSRARRRASRVAGITFGQTWTRHTWSASARTKLPVAGSNTAALAATRRSVRSSSATIPSSSASQRPHGELPRISPCRRAWRRVSRAWGPRRALRRARSCSPRSAHPRPTPTSRRRPRPATMRCVHRSRRTRRGDHRRRRRASPRRDRRHH